MTIASVQFGTGYGPFFESVAGGARDVAASGTGKSDTVTISAQARECALAMQRQMADEQSGDAAAPSGADGDYPLEAYSIPGWYGDLLGGYTEVATTLGASWEDGRTAYSRLNPDDQELYDEYAGLLNEYYDQARADAGISDDIGDYYHNFIRNAANQETVRQDLIGRLSGDPRAVELMRYFGIDS